MTTPLKDQASPSSVIQVERSFRRFARGQRWEHTLLFVTVSILLLTGLPQKYAQTSWSQWIISSPQRLEQLQQIHHIFALLLTAGVLYHLGRAIAMMARRRLSDDIFPHWKDVSDAWQMLKYLLFLTREKPKFGKYNFEQKLTYWFIFFGIGILVVSGFILWFPLQITRVLPGGVVPAAYLAHSNEAIALAVFIIVWHFYHVHFQRLNLSIFTGRITESEMAGFHAAEYERLLSLETMTDEERGENS
jgi:formate dehydrogenase gamma subunit